MKSVSFFFLLLCASCASKIVLNSVGHGPLLHSFNVNSEAEARDLMNSRLTYLRHLLYYNRADPSFKICHSHTLLGEPKKDRSGNLLTVSDVYFNRSDFVDCPGPMARKGILIFAYCKGQNVMREIRIMRPRMNKQVEFECSGN